MFNYFRKELDWGGRKLVLETGKIARQADGAVLVAMATPSCSAPRSAPGRPSPGRISSR